MFRRSRSFLNLASAARLSRFGWSVIEGCGSVVVLMVVVVVLVTVLLFDYVVKKSIMKRMKIAPMIRTRCWFPSACRGYD
jgi:hypothetical protein